MTPPKSVTDRMPTPENPPFWYGSFSAVWVYVAVPISTLDGILAGQNDSLKAFPFDDLSQNGEPMGLMNVNFMTYGSNSGMNDPQAYADILKPITYDSPMPAGFGIEPTHEVEINIVSYSAPKAAQTPLGLSSSDFIRGRDHTKTIGNYRLWVPCDDRIAVYWGMHNFGENKLMTHPFVYNVPAWNNPGRDTWHFTIPGLITESAATSMFTLDVTDLDGLAGVENSNQSEIIDFSLYPHSQDPGAGSGQRLVASRRNAFGAFKALTMDSGQPIPPCTITLGDSNHPIVADLKTMLGGEPHIQPSGLMTFNSAPVVAESSLYYADI